MTPTIPAELLATLIAALVGAVVAYLEKIRRDLAANTATTHEAKKAAEDGQQAVESLQQATFDRLDYDRLRRMENALQTLEACEPCRDAILRLIDRRRVYAPSAPEDTHA